MRLGLVLSIVSVAAQMVAMCSLNSTSTGCALPEVASCVDVCSLHRSNTSCSMVSGCAWANTFCNTVNPTPCYNILSSTNCSAEPMCSWQTVPCQFTELCGSSNLNFTCNGFKNSSSCTANGCSWNATCRQSSVCSLISEQTNCTSKAGCSWIEAGLSNNFSSTVATVCTECFADPSNNIDNTYLLFQSHLGQVCEFYTPNFPSSIRFLSATPAPTGCSGGFPYPSVYDNCTSANFPTPARSTSSPTNPTSSPTTKAPTSPPTSAPTNPTSSPTTKPPTIRPTSEPTQVPTELPDLNAAMQQSPLLSAAVAISMFLCF